MIVVGMQRRPQHVRRGVLCQCKRSKNPAVCKIKKRVQFSILSFLHKRTESQNHVEVGIGLQSISISLGGNLQSDLPNQRNDGSRGNHRIYNPSVTKYAALYSESARDFMLCDLLKNPLGTFQSWDLLFFIILFLMPCSFKVRDRVHHLV